MGQFHASVCCSIHLHPHVPGLRSSAMTPAVGESSQTSAASDLRGLLDTVRQNH